jgi:hypothetical protein
MRNDGFSQALDPLNVMRKVQRLVFGISFALVISTYPRPARSEIRRAAPSRWVTNVSVPSLSSVVSGPPSIGNPSSEAEGRVRLLVHDVQDRFAENEQEAFVHLAYVVRDPTDVQNGSELELNYDPSFESLTLHYVWIHRAGQRIDALRQAELREVSGENDREQFQYDEEKKLVIVLRDVRPLDVIEWAYTTRGQNPAVRGHVLSEPRLARDAAVQRLHVRVVVPTEKRSRHRTHSGAREPEITVVGDFTEYRWDATQVPAIDDEGDTPDWYLPEPWAEVTDFASWSEVAAWALPLYAVTEPLPSELERLIEQWSKLASNSEKVFAAVRFVQEELRYLGMEIGPHSLIPHSPKQTFDRRFGDCKDKTLLLVTILRRLHIEAFPALVSSREGRALPERLPSPYAFDHVITKVVLERETYWFDPTIASERGDLQAHRYCDYEHALVVAEGTLALEPLSRERLVQPFSEVEERYELGDPGQPCALTVKTTLRGGRADEFRARYQRLSRSQLRRDYLNFFAKRFDQVEATSDPTVADDEGTNVIRIEERYRIGGPFIDETMLLSAWSFSELLDVPSVVLRKSPLKVRYPFVAEHRILLDYSTRPHFELPNVSESDETLRFRVSGHETSDRHFAEITYRIESLADSVSPERVKPHLALKRRIDANMDIALERPSAMAHNTILPNPLARPWIWMSAGLLLLLALGLNRKRFMRRNATSWIAEPGESASLPLIVSGIEAAKSHALGLRCRCRRVLVLEPDRSNYVRFDGRRLFAVGLICNVCQTKTSRYYSCDESEPSRSATSESSSSSTSASAPSSDGS